jgi:HK97 family phage major capsid protein
MPIISRSNSQYASPDGTRSGLIPIEFSTQIIQMATQSSLALSSFRQVRMPAGVQHLPVLDALPVAKWVTGEPNASAVGGDKATASQTWKGIVLTAEEVAAIVVIPEAILEDASIDLWAEITPRLAEAIGGALDLAVLAGTDKPASWPDAIIPAAVAKGNVTVAANPDQTHYNTALGQVEADGFMPDIVFAQTGQRANFRSWNASGVPVYLSDFRDDGRVDSIYGLPIRYDTSGALGTSKALMGDPTMAIIGTRTDIQYKVLTEATIDLSAALDGSAMLSLAQQDSVALRVRARFGYAVANPVTRLVASDANRFPFAVINPV